MQRSQNTNPHQLNGLPPSAEQVEEVLRFARKLEMHSDHEQLLRALPAELCVLVDCTMAALVHLNEGQLTTDVVDSEGCSLATDHSAWKQMETEMALPRLRKWSGGISYRFWSKPTGSSLAPTGRLRASASSGQRCNFACRSWEFPARRDLNKLQNMGRSEAQWRDLCLFSAHPI